MINFLRSSSFVDINCADSNRKKIIMTKLSANDIIFNKKVISSCKKLCKYLRIDKKANYRSLTILTFQICDLKNYKIKQHLY